MTPPTQHTFRIAHQSWGAVAHRLQRQHPPEGCSDEAALVRLWSSRLSPDARGWNASPDPRGLAWLDNVYVFVAQGNVDDAVDIIFDRLDDALCEGDFRACDSVLRATDLSRLDTHAIVGFLSITLAAREQLHERSRFVTRAERRLRVLAPDRIDGLMSGLR